MASRRYKDSNEGEMSGDGAQMLDELRQQLRKSLADSETLSRQVQALQTRLEDASREQESLELQIHDKDTKIDGMTNEHRELVKQRRELQDLVEAERGSLVQERERALEQERQSRAVIQRLKESLTQKANRASLEWHEQKSGRSSVAGGEHIDGHQLKKLTLSIRGQRSGFTFEPWPFCAACDVATGHPAPKVNSISREGQGHRVLTT